MKTWETMALVAIAVVVSTGAMQIKADDELGTDLAPISSSAFETAETKTKYNMCSDPDDVKCLAIQAHIDRRSEELLAACHRITWKLWRHDALIPDCRRLAMETVFFEADNLMAVDVDSPWVDPDDDLTGGEGVDELR